MSNTLNIPFHSISMQNMYPFFIIDSSKIPATGNWISISVLKVISSSMWQQESGQNLIVRWTKKDKHSRFLKMDFIQLLESLYQTRLLRQLAELEERVLLSQPNVKHNPHGIVGIVPHSLLATVQLCSPSMGQYLKTLKAISTSHFQS